MGLGKWDQVYGAEVAYNTERFTLAAMGSVGDLLLDPGHVQERGVFAWAARHFAGRASIGGSLKLVTTVTPG